MASGSRRARNGSLIAFSIALFGEYLYSPRFCLKLCLLSLAFDECGNVPLESDLDMDPVMVVLISVS